MVCFACFLPAIDFIAKENFSFTLVNLVSVESMHDASRAFNYFKSTIGLVRLKFGFCVSFSENDFTKSKFLQIGKLAEWFLLPTVF